MTFVCCFSFLCVFMLFVVVGPKLGPGVFKKLPGGGSFALTEHIKQHLIVLGSLQNIAGVVGFCWF